jgi:hypothetical protein
MAVTKTQFRAVFGTTTDAQFDKLSEWMDAVHPKLDGNGDPVPNTLDDVTIEVRRDFTAKFKHWKSDQTSVEF